ncbi:Ankyrin repeat and SOCS box protein 6 [Podospora pseudopauciseta]|uniref:Ankyrin repeat and SOCS box protein 6 n=1 Tax=Podospora pseudopauciseta TaxID=2093780 RepID=A0ABR0H4U2_9PEZI|nr:Ankyrin repeat and SOCS box protein 6 [Podospora pseudopauciseta]
MISGAFHLPHWIASRAIILTLINGPSISVSLTVARIVPPDSDIFRYIQTGNCSGLQTLLLKGQASPADMIESLYGTLDALLFALNCNQYEICQLLLSWGADPHAENSTKLTDSAANMAWNLSIECPSPANNARKHLIESTFPAPLDLDRRQFSLLHKTVLGLAYTNLPALLATCSPDALNARDCHGRTVVLMAAWRGDLKAVTEILAAGADSDLHDGDGRSPLHYAAMTASDVCTRALVWGGADVNKVDNYGETPLHCACSCARLANVEYLLSVGAWLDMANERGVTPLMAAVMAGDVGVVEALIACGVNGEVKDKGGETAVGLAVWGDQTDIVGVLVDKHKGRARLDVHNDSGRTVLHTAARYAGVQTMKRLLLSFREQPPGESSVRLGSRVDGQGMTALERLVERGT